MVGFCHLTDSHHYHHGQKPTMVGICHGGNMPVGHLHHHYLPISFTKYRTSDDQDSALRGDIYIGKGTALLLPYLTIHLISSFSSSLQRHRHHHHKGTALLLPFLLTINLISSFSSSSPKSLLSPPSSPSLCAQDPSSDPATLLLIYLLLL